MKYLLLIAGLYLYYRYRQVKRQQVQGRQQSPIDQQNQYENPQADDDDSEYIDYEELD
ncbi:MAG TPA: hypothetical protein VJ953_05040 [Saprospiraceae bacterium]|nr:hypothetical protein [Saprospiraceae bacterium]